MGSLRHLAAAASKALPAEQGLVTGAAASASRIPLPLGLGGGARNLGLEDFKV